MNDGIIYTQLGMEEQRSYEEILGLHEDLTIKRWQIGDITAWQQLSDGKEQEIYIRLSRNPDSHAWDNVRITAKTVPQKTRYKDNDLDTFIGITLIGKGIKIRVRNRGEHHDPEEVVKTAQNALEVLNAYINASPEVKKKYKDRILDETEGVDYEKFWEDVNLGEEYQISQELRNMGLTSQETDPQPLERYKIVGKILQRPVISIERI